MKKPIEVKKKLKKVTEYTACFAFLMFLQGVGAPMVFADATTAINAKFEILWNLISAVVQSVGGVILLWHAFEFVKLRKKRSRELSLPRTFLTFLLTSGILYIKRRKC